MKLLSRILSLFSAVFWCTASAAAPAALQIGQHQSYSRIVISNLKHEKWSHEQNDESHTIRFGAYASGFDLAGILAKKNHDRIRNISTDNSSITFELNCDCTVDSFPVATEIFAIEIKDPDTLKFATQNHEEMKYVETSNRLSFGKQENVANSTLVRFPVRNSVSFPKSYQNAPVNDNINASKIRPRKTTGATIVATPSQQPQMVNQDINLLQKRLAAEFGLATTRGLLTREKMSKKENSSLNPSFTPNSLEELFRTELKKEGLSVDKTGNTSLKQGETGLRTKSEKCISNNRFQISSWADDRPFTQQIGTANAVLYNPLGEIDIAKAANLARLYIYFGFGAEARQLLEMNSEIAQKWPELVEISYLLEGRSLKQEYSFSRPTHCKEQNAIWSALANSVNSSFIAEDEHEILSELSALPIHLRRLLAPRISNIFLKSGNKDAALAAMNTLKRAKYPLNNSSNFQEAVISIDNNEIETAIEQFSKVESNSELAAEAFLETVKLKLSSGLEIDDATLNLLDSYAAEYEETDLGLKFQILGSHAIAAVGQYEKALARISTFPSDSQTNPLLIVYGIIVEEATDVSFLENAFDRVQKQELSQNTILSLKFAERLSDLGFPQESQKFLSAIDDAEASDKKLLLQAKNLVALEQYADAEFLLENSDGPNFYQIKEKIFEHLGKTELASEYHNRMLAEVQNTTNPDGRAPVTEQGEEISSRINDISVLTETNVAAIDVETPKMLARVSEMLDESQDSRTQLKQLISDPEIFPTPTN